MKRAPLVSLTLLGLGVLSGCAAHAAATETAQPSPVSVERARRPQPEAVFSGPAAIVAAHTYRLAFEIPGRVIRVNADIGDRVAAGQELAAIDDAEYRAQLTASAQRAIAAQAQADDADAAADLARANARRASHLTAQGDISVQARDVAAESERDAQARVAAAVAEANAARANRSLALITLDKASLTAPRDAYVQQRAVEPGEEAEPCLLYTSPSPRDRQKSRMPSSA